MTLPQPLCSTSSLPQPLPSDPRCDSLEAFLYTCPASISSQITESESWVQLPPDMPVVEDPDKDDGVNDMDYQTAQPPASSDVAAPSAPPPPAFIPTINLYMEPDTPEQTHDKKGKGKARR